CHEAVTELVINEGFCFEYNEPPDHEIVPKTRSSIQGNFECASAPSNRLSICSLNKSNTPAKPITSPKMVALLLKLIAQRGLSSTTNHIGAEDTIMATMALGSVFSDHITMPFATKSKSMPVMAARKISLSTNIFSFLTTHQPISKSPAVVNRTAPSKKGGTPPRSAILIKK